MGAVEWQWQAADCTMGYGQSPFWAGFSGAQTRGQRQSGQEAKPPGRRRRGTEGRGCRANVHDTKLLQPTLKRVLVERPGTGIEHLCLDEGLQSKEPRGSSGSRLPGTHPAHRRRNWTPWARNGIQRRAGWWNAPWLGYPSAGRFRFDTTRRHSITSG